MFGLFVVLRRIREYFARMEMSPFPVKGCKVSIHARRLHSVLLVKLYLLRSRSISFESYDKQGVPRTYSGPDPNRTVVTVVDIVQVIVVVVIVVVVVVVVYFNRVVVEVVVVVVAQVIVVLVVLVSFIIVVVV